MGGEGGRGGEGEVWEGVGEYEVPEGVGEGGEGDNV